MPGGSGVASRSTFASARRLLPATLGRLLRASTRPLENAAPLGHPTAGFEPDICTRSNSTCRSELRHGISSRACRRSWDVDGLNMNPPITSSTGLVLVDGSPYSPNLLESRDSLRGKNERKAKSSRHDTIYVSGGLGARTGQLVRLSRTPASRLHGTAWERSPRWDKAQRAGRQWNSESLSFGEGVLPVDLDLHRSPHHCQPAIGRAHCTPLQLELELEYYPVGMWHYSESGVQEKQERKMRFRIAIRSPGGQSAPLTSRSLTLAHELLLYQVADATSRWVMSSSVSAKPCQPIPSKTCKDVQINGLGQRAPESTWRSALGIESRCCSWEAWKTTYLHDLHALDA